MRNSIPIHYALLGAALSLAIGVLIGTQASGPSAAEASHRAQSTRAVIDSYSSESPQQSYADSRSKQPSKGDRYEANTDTLNFDRDPVSTLASVLEQNKGLERDQRLRNVVDGWAAKDSKAAFDWLDTHSHQIGTNLPDLYATIMSHHISQNPEASKWVIGEMKPSALKDTLAAELAQTLADIDPMQALRWSESLQNGDARKIAIDVALQTYAQNNPEAALQYASSVADPQRQKQMMHEVGFVMASIDPIKTMTALDQFPTEMRARLVPRIAWAMSRKNPEQTIDWVNQLPSGGTRDQAIREASWGLVASNPEHAFRLVSTVDDSAMRYSLVRDALMAWHRTDPVSSQQALQTYFGMDQADKNFLLQDLKQNASAPDMVAPY